MMTTSGMPEKKFPLEPEGPERLSLSWRGNFKEMEISVDGDRVGSFDDAKALKEGGTFALPDGSSLEVKLAAPFLLPELQITRDGEPVPGSPGHPVTRHAGAYNMIFVIAALNVGVGLLGALTGAAFFLSLGIGWASVLTGIVYAILGLFVKRGSIVALGLAVGLFVLDGIALLASGAPGSSPPVGGLVARLFFLLPMLRGFSALRELKEAPPARPTRRARPSPASERPPARAPAAASPAPVRTLTGDAEKRRLQMTERVGATSATNMRRPSIGGGQPSTETVAQALRFTAHKCEIVDGGLRVTSAPGKTRDVRWSEVGRLVVRQLPPDPPWDAAVLLDVVALVDGTRWEPVRIFLTTFVNYAALAEGASTSRLENIRNLTRLLRDRNPGVALDPETTAFLDGKGAPARFANMTQFAEYDSHYR